MRTTSTVIATTALLLTLAGCGSADSEAGPSAPEDVETSLEAAYDECANGLVGNPLAPEAEQPEAAQFLSVEDDGHSLIVDGASDSYSSIGAATCVLDELDVPTATRTNMESTTSLMGRQTDEWDGYTASWSYHPDNGFDLVLQED